jgi:hypothetical protein
LAHELSTPEAALGGAAIQERDDDQKDCSFLHFLKSIVGRRLPIARRYQALLAETTDPVFVIRKLPRDLRIAARTFQGSQYFWGWMLRMELLWIFGQAKCWQSSNASSRGIRGRTAFQL